MTLATTSFEEAAAGVHDVIVVGAGPAGSVTALEIARRGLKVLLVDRYEFPRHKLCGACLSGSAVQQLHQMGLSERLEALAGIPLQQFEMHSADKRLQLPIHGGLALSRHQLDTMLVKVAIEAGVDFLPGTALNVAAASGEPFRRLSRQFGDSSQFLRGRIVVMASGLSSARQTNDPALTTQPAAGSRFGAGTRATSFPAEYERATIYMAVAENGYVGLTQTEDGVLNLAAALDHAAVRSASPLVVCRQILESCRFPVSDEMLAGEWKGTVGLTRRTRDVASERLFVVGDAAGYIEPFTGEGMAWGVRGGRALAPLAERAVERWQPEFTGEWRATLRRLLGGRQRRCQRLATVLRYPRLTRTVMSIASLLPFAARAVARRIHESA